MMNLYLISLLTLACSLQWSGQDRMATDGDSTPTIGRKEYSLHWADEFEKNGAPDPAKWGYDIGTGKNGWGNRELQYYTDRQENVFVDNGTLKIRAIREDYKGSVFTSARLLSKGKFEFKYGRIEFRAKLPAQKGTWPAAWMLGGDIGKVGWPACGEVDVLEHRGSDLDNIVGALHFPGRSGGNPNKNIIHIPGASEAFHVYRFDWTDSRMDFYVDDRLFHSVTNLPELPYHKDFFILLNLAMGGSFGGEVDPGFKSALYEIDYVRVYK